MKKYLYINLLCIAMPNILFGQTGIGTITPNSNTILHVSEKRTDSSPATDNAIKGIILPRLTELERDVLTYVNPTAVPKVFKLTNADHGLMIYNSSENCYNYWNSLEKEWKSLCGKLGKATFIIDCGRITVQGDLTHNKELNSGNYLKVVVDVTKAGAYSIMGTTTNGYNFYTTGTFLAPGEYTVMVPGQGTPQAVQTDQIAFENNGINIVCSPPITANVLPAAATFSILCNTAIVNGIYKTGTNLALSNTITLNVNVTALGSYDIETDTIGGISFAGSGVFTSIGNQNITLYGYGVPLSTADKPMILVSNSAGFENKKCKVTVRVTLHTKRILTIGNLPNSNGYNFSGTAASGQMLKDANNYGNLSTSIVKVENIVITDGGGNPSASNLTSELLSASPADIVIIGFDWSMSDSEAAVLEKYLERKGVILLFCEANTGLRRLFRTIFNNTTITVGGVHAAGAVYQLPLLDDPIMNGPFGDIRGKHWGEDRSATSAATQIPLSEINVYSLAADMSQPSPTPTNAITSFRHKYFNLIWVGDGGFNANSGPSNTSSTGYPFMTNSNNYPIFKPNFGRGSVKHDVYNAVFTANAIAWAMRQAEFNGINTP